MMTKDKKPFTYTPGGIDLSEIRSPRMARRLERNAMSEGVTPSQGPPNQQRTGPLPPSALAAMQPQLPVQVFPPGKVPQLPHGGPPPPPPPPMKPLPLDTFERPDMTKIIPDNPMALLRKTQGPVVKQDPILNKANYSSNTTNDAFVPQRHVDNRVNNGQVASNYAPPAVPQSPPFSRDSPTGAIPAPPAFYKRQPSLQQADPPSPPYIPSKQPPTYDIAPKPSESPKPTLTKAATPWLKQKSLSQEVPEWAVNDQRANNASNDEQAPVQKPKQQRPWSQKSLEKPDSDSRISHEPQQWQQQTEPQYQRQPDPQRQQRQVEQPKQPEQHQWQQKQPDPQRWQQKQPEPQRWEQKQHEPQQWQQNQQPSRPAQSPPVHIPQAGGVRNQIKNRETPQEYFPNEKVEVVIVNDPPMILQHPGQTQRVQRQQPLPPQNQGVRIIPVQIEGSTSNGHSNSDPRALNRQLSWNSTPTQSNTFKVLQKITHTDGDDEESDQIAIEHSPKTPHNFPQQNVHRTKHNQGDQEVMNKFKQGIDQDNSLHTEIDPRYRGPHIPSKAFKLLQNMTSGQDEQPTSSSVPQEEQFNRGPKVRTIPIQIEGDGPMRTFVHPSEQTVAEPKKYMGSSIPGRSFKILQAMTAPDECGPGQSDL